MQQLLEGLEADDLVVRHPDPSDAHAQVVSLAARGEQLVHGAGVILAAIERRLAGEMGPDAVAELRDLSVRLLAARSTPTDGTERPA